MVNGQVADLVAKVPSVDFILHNGKFGCLSCLHSGQKMPCHGNKCVYPYTPTIISRQTHGDFANPRKVVVLLNAPSSGTTSFPGFLFYAPAPHLKETLLSAGHVTLQISEDLVICYRAGDNEVCV